MIRVFQFINIIRNYVMIIDVRLINAYVIHIMYTTHCIGIFLSKKFLAKSLIMFLSTFISYR